MLGYIVCWSTKYSEDIQHVNRERARKKRYLGRKGVNSKICINEGKDNKHCKTAHSPNGVAEILIKGKQMLIKHGILTLIPRSFSL